MNGATFRLAVRQALPGALVTALGLGVFFWVIMVSSSGFAGEPGNLPPFLLRPPRAVRALVGGSFDFTAPQGWLSTGVFHPVVLSLQTLGAFLVATGSGVTELDRGTLDLVLARPVSRRSYLLARAAAALVVLTIVEAGGLIGALVSRQTVSGAATLPIEDIALVFAGSWVLFAAFAMAALAIFAIAHLRGRALGVAIGMVVATFFFNFLSLLFEAFEWIRFFSPFHYYGAREMLSGGPWVGGTVVLGAIAVASLGIAIVGFERRDLTR
ncbi:MAG TPA: ABC transporter permease subunit [Actinomycetota bacterium]|nr:ABC transporter permease subunit [Actinomycetota bacterium]